jgi:hypothetical protein
VGASELSQRSAKVKLPDGASAGEDELTKKGRLLRTMAALKPADQDRWRALRRHVVRMRDALALGQSTLTGEPLTSVTAHMLEGYVKFGLGEK